MKTPRLIALAASATLALLLVAGCTDESSGGAQKSGQAQTEDAFAKQQAAVPYPASALNDSLERRNVKERLLRYNSPSKISYIYLMSQTGGIYAYFTIKGKVSSTNSQLTPPQNINYDQGSGGGGNTTTESMGDDGSYGPEECGSLGVFFFDTNTVMHEWCGQWAYSDAPMNLRQPPLIVQSGDAKPSTSAGQLK